MAIFATSTTAPALHPRLLRPFTFRPAPPVDDARSTDELLEEIRRAIDGQEALLSARSKIRANDISGLAIHGDTPICPAAGQNPKPSAAPHVGARCVDIDIPLAARALHMRRELHQALDHGFALLDALDLPPLALDVIDDAIATMDALDAPDEDREDDDPAEGTSLERHGRGFIRCGADDAEEDDEPERDDEPGSDDGEDIGHHASQFRPFPLSHAERAELAFIAARAAATREAAHA